MYKLFKLIEKVFAFLQGKGYGTYTVKNEVKNVKKIIKNVSVAFDIGGNKGKYSENIRKFFPNSKIIIFEPSEVNIDCLKSKFQYDPLVVIEPYGLSDFEGKTTLYSDQQGSGMASLTQRNLKHFNKKMDKHEEISIITFASYYKNYYSNQIIDFVKLDVEGHELSVLQGMKESIKNIRCIQFEFGGCNLDTKTIFQDFWYYFKGLNFEIHRITPFGLMHLTEYSEMDEYYRTTNFICLNTRFKNQ